MRQIHDDINRRAFLDLMAGILSGLGLYEVTSSSASAENEVTAKPVELSDSYLVKGLTAMARAGNWFDAHWGAGILASYYLCKDNVLGHEVTMAIKQQMDTVIQSRGSQFEPLEVERSDASLIDNVPNALLPLLREGLRSHGHAAIFASLSTRSLKDVPQMAQPSIIKGLVKLTQRIGKTKPAATHDTGFVYANSDSMIDATMNSLARFQGLIGKPAVRRPNFTHMVTHTEALLNLDLMGYGELARMGHAGLKTHIGAPVPEVEELRSTEHRTVGLSSVMSTGFWSDKENQDRWGQAWDQANNPNGDWIAAGHLFKVLYSFHRLALRVPDKKKVELCSAILLERYVDPNVQGG